MWITIISPYIHRFYPCGQDVQKFDKVIHIFSKPKRAKVIHSLGTGVIPNS